MSDLLRALAFAFRRKGGVPLSRMDLLFQLAMDLRWFAPEDAKRVVARGLEVGLLREADGVLQPAFDAQLVDIPLNWRPTGKTWEDDAGDFPPLEKKGRDAPARAAPRPEPTLAAPPPTPDDAVEVERKRRGGLLDADVAALVVARRLGEDVRARALEAEARRLRPARPGAEA